MGRLQPNCAIHVRRGDYVHRTQYNPVCSLDYYRSAIELFAADTAFLVFSDDIEWCKQRFDSPRFTFSEQRAPSDSVLGGNLQEEIDLYLMSMCQHQIIANSTFSWWGSWLNHCIWTDRFVTLLSKVRCGKVLTVGLGLQLQQKLNLEEKSQFS
jgi:Glycosyl transferase family 11